MKNKSIGESIESQYPSVDLAYEFSKSSYGWMLNRIEAINGRIQGLLTLATAITATLPILGKAMFENIEFQSVWFYVAIAIYILFVSIGTIGLSMGRIRLVHPKNLYEKWLSDSPWEFKKDIVYFAGQDLDHNKKIVDSKSRLRNIMNIILVIELLMIVIWIATAT